MLKSKTKMNKWNNSKTCNNLDKDNEDFHKYHRHPQNVADHQLSTLVKNLLP